MLCTATAVRRCASCRTSSGSCREGPSCASLSGATLAVATSARAVADAANRAASAAPCTCHNQADNRKDVAGYPLSFHLRCCLLRKAVRMHALRISVTASYSLQRTRSLCSDMYNHDAKHLIDSQALC